MSTTETTHPLSWLSAICTPDRPRKHGLCANPWLLGWGGRRQVVATDATLIVVLDGKDPPPDARLAEQSVHDTLLSVLDRPLPALKGRADAAGLAAWCGPHDPGHEEPCEQCGGDGRCECPRCDGDHDCGVCRGSGRQGPMPPLRPGRLGGRCVDRNRLTKAVSHLTGPCEVRAGHDRLALVGGDWLVLLAPMTGEGGEEDEPEFTAWAQMTGSVHA